MSETLRVATVLSDSASAQAAYTALHGLASELREQASRRGYALDEGRVERVSAERADSVFGVPLNGGESLTQVAVAVRFGGDDE